MSRRKIQTRVIRFLDPAQTVTSVTPLCSGSGGGRSGVLWREAEGLELSFTKQPSAQWEQHGL